MRAKKAIYNVSSTLLAKFVIIIYGLIIPKIIIQNYGSDVNGLVSSITQFLSYITLLESGIGPVVTSLLYKPIAKKDKKSILNILKASEKFFRKIAIIFIMYILFLLIIYPNIINNQFESIYTISLIIIISLSTFAEYFFGLTYRLYLQAKQETYVISLIQILIYILNIIFIVLLIKLNFSIQVVKLISGMIFILRPIFQNIYVRKKYNIQLNEADSKYELSQKWDGLAQHIASVIHNNTDITVLTIFTNLTEVSIYSVYYLIVSGIKSIVMALSGGIEALFGDMIAKEEKENLNNKFSIYEIIYFGIITVVYTCTLALIIPFVKIYTINITDANYIRITFAYLLVVAEYFWAIRLPYNTITHSAGHFKETQKGAWIEAIVNIIISVVLVFKYGIVGVAIGTLIAMLIRTIDLIMHVNNHILMRKNTETLKKVLIILLETSIILFILKFLPEINIRSYFTWIINALIDVLISSIVVILVSLLAYKKELKELLKIIKKIFKRKVK